MRGERRTRLQPRPALWSVLPPLCLPLLARRLASCCQVPPQLGAVIVAVKGAGEPTRLWVSESLQGSCGKCPEGSGRRLVSGPQWIWTSYAPPECPRWAPDLCRAGGTPHPRSFQVSSGGYLTRFLFLMSSSPQPGDPICLSPNRGTPTFVPMSRSTILCHFVSAH